MCAAFVVGIVLARIGMIEATAYVDPVVCIPLSLLFLKKPYDILRDSIADLVDANPYGEAANAVEESASQVAERFHLKGVEWVRVRKAGRRMFVTASFLEDASGSIDDVDRVSQALIDELTPLELDVDVVVACRLAPAPEGAMASPPPEVPTAASS